MRILVITIIFLISCFVGLGAFFIICHIMDVPTSEASHIMLESGKTANHHATSALEIYLQKISSKLAPVINAIHSPDAMKKNNIENALRISGKDGVTAEEYYANCVTIALLVGVCGIPLAVISIWLIPVMMVLGGLLGVAKYYEPIDKMKTWRKKIEYEAPRFTSAIASGLSIDRDIYRIFQGYREVAGEEFGVELDYTIAEMTTGNYENALQRFENRVGSLYITNIVRGLQGVLRGDDEVMYFKLLEHDMEIFEQNNLKAEAMKKPRRMRKYSMFMLGGVLAIYVYVLGVIIVENLGLLFEDM